MIRISLCVVAVLRLPCNANDQNDAMTESDAEVSLDRTNTLSWVAFCWYKRLFHECWASESLNSSTVRVLATSTDAEWEPPPNWNGKAKEKSETGTDKTIDGGKRKQRFTLIAVMCAPLEHRSLFESVSTDEEKIAGWMSGMPTLDHGTEGWTAIAAVPAIPD